MKKNKKFNPYTYRSKVWNPIEKTDCPLWTTEEPTFTPPEVEGVPDFNKQWLEVINYKKTTQK